MSHAPEQLSMWSVEAPSKIAGPVGALALAPSWASGELAKLPVLSIRQPWAWMIVHGGKDIENRNWPTKFRGRFLIHAGKGCTRQEYEDAEGFAWCNDVAPPPLAELKRGGIVGVAEIVDCVDDSESDWFVGQYGFVLRNAQPLDFLPCAGALGFFRLPNVEMRDAPAANIQRQKKS